jgi:succinate dehydrogenase / fumarate reductase cytochrome b subunit
MKNFLTSSSIGRKLVMSISGCLLVLFLTFHMAMNVTAIFSEDAYNAICEFLGANWYAVAGTAVLALGVFIHIIYAIMLTLQNRKARGNKRYAVTAHEKGVAWSSKNMFVLGLIILFGLCWHVWDFWSNMMLVELAGEHVNKFGIAPADGAAMIRHTFSNPYMVVMYLIWFAAIWYHLTHGVWSMFQSVGFANQTWYPRLKLLANAWATILVFGFAVVVIGFYFRSNGICLLGICGL